MGVNGAGKSTITKLLTGLYDEYEGEILINGKELRFYPAAALKALFSVIYQDFSHYQISLLDNIAIGDISHETDDSRILQAALEVGLGETVNKMKDGIKTQLGKIDADGIDISGGQWQKIAIARSVISTAPIKILDEPTASLDPISENKLYKQFKEIMAEKTAILISHRLGAARLVDEIFVLDKGIIAERGCHNELMKRKGIYAHMFDEQREWYE